MFEDLPEIKPYIQNIRVLENRKFLMAIETGLERGKLMSDFLVNASSFSSYYNFQEKLIKYKKARHFALWTTIETLPLHEAGHIIESAIVDKHYSEKDKMKVFSSSEVAKTLLQTAAKKINVNLDNEIQSISVYAKSNYSESFAEVIHKELSGNGNDFTKEVD